MRLHANLDARRSPTERSSAGMKRCPFCAEEIQDAAIKCKHCGSNLDSASVQASTGQLRELLLKGEKIKAIKLVRDERHVSLSEAKDAVEGLIAAHPEFQSADERRK